MGGRYGLQSSQAHGVDSTTLAGTADQGPPGSLAAIRRLHFCHGQSGQRCRHFLQYPLSSNPFLFRTDALGAMESAWFDTGNNCTCNLGAVSPKVIANALVTSTAVSLDFQVGVCVVPTHCRGRWTLDAACGRRHGYGACTRQPAACGAGPAWAGDLSPPARLNDTAPSRLLALQGRRVGIRKASGPAAHRWARRPGPAPLSARARG